MDIWQIAVITARRSAIVTAQRVAGHFSSCIASQFILVGAFLITTASGIPICGTVMDHLATVTEHRSPGASASTVVHRGFIEFLARPMANESNAVVYATIFYARRCSLHDAPNPGAKAATNRPRHRPGLLQMQALGRVLAPFLPTPHQGTRLDPRLSDFFGAHESLGRDCRGERCGGQESSSHPTSL